MMPTNNKYPVKAFYGCISVKLLSTLRIGGGEEEYFGLVTDGDGRYRIPATSFAGVVLHYADSLPEDEKQEYRKLLGNESEDSREISKIWFYDATCENVRIERRMRVRMDHENGVAREGKLFHRTYLGSGLQTVLKMQGFAADDNELKQIQDVFHQTAEGIQKGAITFGSSTSTGSGRFQVTGVRGLVLDLQDQKQRETYLQGPSFCFEQTSDRNLDFKLPELLTATDTTCDILTLSAYCPEGMIVKNGKPVDIGGHSAAVSMNFSDEGGRPVYYVPGTQLKGLLRTYTEKLQSVLSLPDSIQDALFGSSPDDQDNRCAGILKFEDAEIPNAKKQLVNRIRIDRFTGSVINQGMFLEQLVYTDGDHPIQIRIRVMHREGAEDQRNIADAAAFLFLRDLGLGLLSLGSSASVGHGVLAGVSLSMEGERRFSGTFQNDAFVPGDDASQSVIQAMLEAMQGERSAQE